MIITASGVPKKTFIFYLNTDDESLVTFKVKKPSLEQLLDTSFDLVSWINQQESKKINISRIHFDYLKEFSLRNSHLFNSLIYYDPAGSGAGYRTQILGYMDNRPIFRRVFEETNSIGEDQFADLVSLASELFGPKTATSLVYFGHGLFRKYNKIATTHNLLNSEIIPESGFIDQSHPQEFSFADFTKQLQKAQQKGIPGEKNKFESITLLSCSMAFFEVLEQMHPLADYLLVNQLPNGHRTYFGSFQFEITNQSTIEDILLSLGRSNKENAKTNILDPSISPPINSSRWTLFNLKKFEIFKQDLEQAVEFIKSYFESTDESVVALIENSLFKAPLWESDWSYGLDLGELLRQATYLTKAPSVLWSVWLQLTDSSFHFAHPLNFTFPFGQTGLSLVLDPTVQYKREMRSFPALSWLREKYINERSQLDNGAINYDPRPIRENGSPIRLLNLLKTIGWSETVHQYFQFSEYGDQVYQQLKICLDHECVRAKMTSTFVALLTTMNESQDHLAGRLIHGLEAIRRHYLDRGDSQWRRDPAMVSMQRAYRLITQTPAGRRADMAMYRFDMGRVDYFLDLINALNGTQGVIFP